MKKQFFKLLIALAPFVVAGNAYAVAVTDTIEYPTPEFVDPSDPYGNYRWWDEDWGWTHNAIGVSVTSATLNIAAYDVDYCATETSGCEWDMISAYDSGTWVDLGLLEGSNNTWDFTTFTLGSNFFDDIAAGLQVRIDIDQNNTEDNWAVALSKSALSINGGVIPDPDPGTTPVPAPAGLALLGLGLVGLGFSQRRRNS